MASFFRRLRATLGPIALAALAACTQQVLPPLAAGPSAVDATQYRLAAGDKLRIDTFGEATLSGEFEVAASGAVSMPLIGDVKAQGQTPAELARAIENGLRGGYLRNPRVGVQVLNYRPFYILGEVTKPGTYSYSVGLTVLSAVATAEGFTYRADKKSVFVRHMGDPQETQVPLSAATPVLPGDTIRVGERYF